MADGIVQVQPDSTGKKVDTSELLVGSNTVERQRMVIADSFNSGGLASVGNTVPSASDYGMTIRIAGPSVIGTNLIGATQLISGTSSPTYKISLPVVSDTMMVVGSHPNSVTVSRLSALTSASVASHAVVELGSSVGRIQKFITSNSISNTTANTTIATYIVTATKSLFVQQITLAVMDGLFSAGAMGTNIAGANYFGTVQVVVNGTTINTIPLAGEGYAKPLVLLFTDPIWVAGSTTISLVATPAFTSSMAWYGSITAFEK